MLRIKRRLCFVPSLLFNADDACCTCEHEGVLADEDSFTVLGVLVDSGVCCEDLLVICIHEPSSHIKDACQGNQKTKECKQ